MTSQIFHLKKKKVLFPHDNVSVNTYDTSKLVELSPIKKLCSVSQREKVTRRRQIWVEWRCYRRHVDLHLRPPENVFICKRVKDAGESLGQVNRTKKRLCIIIFSKILFLFYTPNNYWTISYMCFRWNSLSKDPRIHFIAVGWYICSCDIPIKSLF